MTKAEYKMLTTHIRISCTASKSEKVRSEFRLFAGAVSHGFERLSDKFDIVKFRKDCGLKP